MRFTKREAWLLLLSWCLWAISAGLAVHWKIQLNTLEKVSHYPDLNGRVQQLEYVNNKLRYDRDEWRKKFEEK